MPTKKKNTKKPAAPKKQAPVAEVATKPEPITRVLEKHTIRGIEVDIPLFQATFVDPTTGELLEEVFSSKAEARDWRNDLKLKRKIWPAKKTILGMLERLSSMEVGKHYGISDISKIDDIRATMTLYLSETRQDRS